MLFTLLGEFVLPGEGAAWTSAVLAAFERMGVAEKATRQALMRTANAGWLSAEKVGRRTRWLLTPAATKMLTDGARRIYSFGALLNGTGTAWDGQWVLVQVRIPEADRRARHVVRTRLAWAGFGSLGGGLWITPHAEREHELADVAGDGSAAELVSFRAELGALGEPARVVAEAWDLEALADAYRAFVTRFGRMRPDGPEAEFRAQTLLVHEWRRFPFLDPDLPDGMLPARWPRGRGAGSR